MAAGTVQAVTALDRNFKLTPFKKSLKAFLEESLLGWGKLIPAAGKPLPQTLPDRKLAEL